MKVELTEDFAPIPGHDGYYAKRDGTLWSAWVKGAYGGSFGGAVSGRKGDTVRKLLGKACRSGHRDVKLRDRRFYKWHHLVLMAFVGPRPDGMECRHLNGQPSDNRLENLAWGTRKENVQDSISHGTFLGKRRRREFV